MVNTRLFDKLSWEEFQDKVMRETKTTNPKFKSWMADKQSLGGTFFDSLTWLMQYNVWKEINKTNDDFVEIVCGKEGSGKSTLAQQKAAVVDPTFCKERIMNSPLELFQWLKTNDSVEKTQGKAIILDEGVLFVFSRRTMSKQNVDVVTMFQLIRQMRMYIIICIPEYTTLDKYLRIRAKGFTQITRKHSDFKYYIERGKEIINHALQKNVPYKKIKVPANMWFDGRWNSETPNINDFNIKDYKNIKVNAFKDFVNGALESVEEKKSTFVSVREVSEELGLGLSTVAKHIHDGKIPGHKLGEKWLIPRNYLEKMKNMGSQGSVTPINRFDWSVEEK